MLQSETTRKYDTYKDSGIEWIGEIPQDWTVIKIKYLAKITSGDGLTKELLCENGNFPVFGGGSIIGYTNNYNTTPDNILIGRVGANCGCITWLNNNCWATDNALKVKLMANFHKKLFYYFLISLELNRLNDSNAQPLITSTKILNTFVSYPADIQEQQRIAEYLDKKCGEIDRVVETEKSVIEKLKEYKQSIITEAVTKGLDKSAPLKDSGIEWIGKIPQHWEVRKLKTIGDYRNGLTYSPEDMCEEEQGTLVLRSSNIRRGKLFLNDNVYVSVDIPNVLKVQKGDILVCSRNGSRDLIGKNAIIDSDINASFGAFMMILRCNCPKYMYYILNSHIFNYYLGSFFTSTINQLTGKNFGGMDIVFCPDTSEQNAIIEYLDQKCSEIDKAIADKEQVIEKFTEYKKSLIYECVTGKRKVVE